MTNLYCGHCDTNIIDRLFIENVVCTCIGIKPKYNEKDDARGMSMTMVTCQNFLKLHSDFWVHVWSVISINFMEKMILKEYWLNGNRIY